MNSWGTVGVRQVEEPEVAEVRDGVAATNPHAELGRECGEDVIAVLGPDRAGLMVLDDHPADVPVREHHLAVHRSHDARPGIVEDRDDALEERAQIRGPKPTRW